MKVAIVGSRAYGYHGLVRQWVQRLAAKHPDATVISGAARGVDSVAAHQARLEGLEVTEFPADWETFGRSAGFKRNRDIVAASNVVIAFWDGRSRGTKHSLDLAVEMGKPAWVMGVTGKLQPYRSS